MKLIYHINKDSRTNHYGYVKTNNKILYFFPTGKTGGCFLRYYLKMDLEIWDPYKYKTNEDNIIKQFNHIFINSKNVSIIILRNPLNKLISSYLEIVCPCCGIANKIGQPRSETKEITMEKLYYKTFLEGNIYKSFSLFLDMLIEGDKYDPHIWNQFELIKKFYGINPDELKKKFNHVLFSEILQEQCDELCEKYNIIPNKNEMVNEGNQNVKQEITKIIDVPIIREKITIALKNDIEHYNRLAKYFGKYDRLKQCTKNFDIYEKLFLQ